MTPNGYYVQYGLSAFVGHFTATESTFERGARVVIRSPRGVEIGTVLCPSWSLAHSPALDAGEVLRPAGDEDDALAGARTSQGIAILDMAALTTLPLTFLDVEVMLDGSAAILHALPWGSCDAEDLFTSLSAEHGLPVRMLDLSHSPVAVDPPTTCGKPDCGSGNCTSCGTGGCSTGSCSRGAVRSAADLTAYFADLRAKMEAAGRTPLN